MSLASFLPWCAGRYQEEYRVDPEDGLAYSKEDFIEAYGGTDEWDRALPEPLQAVPSPAPAPAGAASLMRA